jgi:hypothetical protein
VEEERNFYQMSQDNGDKAKTQVGRPFRSGKITAWASNKQGHALVDRE